MKPDQPALETWIVLRNAQAQYALWPVVRPVPTGWSEVGPEGDLATCQAWIARRWTDQRPASHPHDQPK